MHSTNTFISATCLRQYVKAEPLLHTPYKRQQKDRNVWPEKLQIEKKKNTEYVETAEQSTMTLGQLCRKCETQLPVIRGGSNNTFVPIQLQELLLSVTCQGPYSVSSNNRVADGAKVKLASPEIGALPSAFPERVSF